MQENTVTVTNAAFKKIRQIQLEENSISPLRVFVQGGGCSGFQYGFTFEEECQKDTDFVIEDNLGTKVYVDAMSMNLLNGAEIDYKKDLMSEQFIIRNPNVSTTCGCGSSFSV